MTGHFRKHTWVLLCERIKAWPKGITTFIHVSSFNPHAEGELVEFSHQLVFRFKTFLIKTATLIKLCSFTSMYLSAVKFGVFVISLGQGMNTDLFIYSHVFIWLVFNAVFNDTSVIWGEEIAVPWGDPEPSVGCWRLRWPRTDITLINTSQKVKAYNKVKLQPPIWNITYQKEGDKSDLL